MAREFFKNATVGNIRTLLQLPTVTRLTSPSALPKNYLYNEEEKNEWAKVELVYYDFQEAFSKFNLITRACQDLHYYP